jgi:hypothetical protein
MRILILLLIALLMATAQPAAAATSPATTLYQLIQKEHNRVCGRTLYHATKSNRLAKWRTDYMASRNYLSHKIGGSYFYDYLDNFGNNLWVSPYASEIIGTARAEDPGTYVFHLFMQSDAHRHAIQNCTYNAVGVAATQGSSDYWYFAGIFTKQQVRRADYSGVPVRTGPSGTYPVRYRLSANQSFMGFWHYANGYWQGHSSEGAGYVKRISLH